MATAFKRDRREYHRALRASPGYSEAQRLKREAKMRDSVFAEQARRYERERSARRRAEDRERINALARVRHSERMASNPEYREQKASHALKWIKAHPAQALANVVRRDAQRLRAIPAWADKEHIQAFYDVAAAYRAIGVACEVDHIVPLRSPRVCGLHVSDNLQLLDPLLNKSKGNRYWPHA